jgi:hypothetical protein
MVHQDVQLSPPWRTARRVATVLALVLALLLSLIPDDGSDTAPDMLRSGSTAPPASLLRDTTGLLLPPGEAARHARRRAPVTLGLRN